MSHNSDAPALERYRGYRLAGAPGTHRGLPSQHLTFIISLDEPVDIARMPEGGTSPGKFQAFVGGLHSSAASIRHEGYQFGISLSLTPLGARSLLKDARPFDNNMQQMWDEYMKK